MRTCLTILLLVLAAHSYGQHTGLFSQYMFNGLVINPAYTGSKGFPVVNMSYRNQWAGFEGAPVTQILSGHMPIRKKDIAVGLMLDRETIGVSRDMGAMATGAYILKLRRTKVNFGLGVGFESRRAGWTDVNLDEINDELFAIDGTNQMRPRVSTGVFFYSKNWYAGYSVPQMVSHSYSGADEYRISFNPFDMNHMITAGYTHDINRHLTFKPSLLIKTLPSSGSQFDLNSNLIIQRKFWIGASYRWKESVIGLIEYQMNPQMRVGYSYDQPTFKIGSYSAGSHELMFIYEFRASSVAKNPRYF